MISFGLMSSNLGPTRARVNLPSRRRNRGPLDLGEATEYPAGMETLWTIILGAVQGATEFLPVSSSGHLAVGQLLLSKGETPVSLSDQPLLLEILLHLATLAAVLVFYRREALATLIGAGHATRAIFRRDLLAAAQKDDGVNTAVAIVLGTVPTGIIGLAVHDLASQVSRSPLAIGLAYLGCACILMAGRWWTGGEKRLSWRLALLIGVAQGIAVLPGISRSGTTIIAALALGLGREEAARFSFLLSIPAILAAAALDLDLEALSAGGRILPYAAGAAAAFAVGLLALFLLVKLVKGGRLWLFAPYVAALGVVSLVFF